MTHTCPHCKVEKPQTTEHFAFRKDANRYRTICRPCAAIPRRKENDKRDDPVDREKVPNISPIPIRDWLIKEYGPLEGGNTGQKGKFGVVQRIANKCGVDTETIRHIKRGKRNVRLDTVDRILIAHAMPHLLRELYPELYDFTPEEELEALIELEAA